MHEPSSNSRPTPSSLKISLNTDLSFIHTHAMNSRTLSLRAFLTIALMTGLAAFTACNKSDSGGGGGSAGKTQLTIGVAFETLQAACRDGARYRARSASIPVR